jgi:hypothetical protein
MAVCTGPDFEKRKREKENPAERFLCFFSFRYPLVTRSGGCKPKTLKYQAWLDDGVSLTEPNHHQLRQQEAGKQADDEIDREVHGDRRVMRERGQPHSSL